MKATRKDPCLTRNFIADLESVFATDASDDIPIWDLKGLGQRLRKSREYYDQELNDKISKLPADHPVMCPIGIFGVMELGRLEVAHTRTLAWILDPKKISEHGFGDVLLQAFLRQICECDTLSSIDVCKVDAERVFRDSFTGDAGRTDIWIEGNAINSIPWLVVIEAKIDASEGNQQLERYNGEIKKWRAKHRDGEVHRVFLTPDGRRPKSGQGWKPVSFSQLTRVFWDAICDRSAEPGYHFIRHYLGGVLKDIVGLPTGRANLQRNPYKVLEFLRGKLTPPPRSEGDLMACLNRAFGFYIKYWQEMEAFHVNEAPLPPSSRKDAPEMIKRVALCACKQAAAFLTNCGKEIDRHFSETRICRTKIAIRRGAIENYWRIEFRLAPSGSRKSTKLYLTTGAAIMDSHDDPNPSIFLYFWTSGRKGQGRRQAEEDLAKLLGEKRVKARAAVLGWGPGHVAFGKIMHKEKVDNKTFGIEEEELLEEVRASLKTIRKKDVERLLEI